MSRFGSKIYKNSDIKKLAQAIESNYHGKYRHDIKVYFSGKTKPQKTHYENAMKVIGQDLKVFIANKFNQLHWFVPTVEDNATIHLTWTSDKMLTKAQIDTIKSWLNKRIQEYYPNNYLSSIIMTDSSWNIEW